MTTAASHPEELLSAYADGELDAATAAQVEAHLAGCAACRTELEALEATRSWLRALPPPSPPPTLSDDLVVAVRRRVRAPWLGALGLVAVAAVWVVVLGSSSVHPRSVDPAVAELVGNHSQAAALVGTPFSSVVAEGAAVVDVRTSAGATVVSHRFPTALGSLPLVLVVSRGDLQQAVYSDGWRTASIFVLRGALAERSTSEVQRVRLAQASGWRVAYQRTDVVALQHDRLVYVVVAPAGSDLVRELDARLPEGPTPSWRDRLVEAGKGLLEAFSG